MALADTFRAMLAAEKADDGEAIDRLIAGTGYDPGAVTDAYIKWSKTGQVVEPNPLKAIAQGAQLGWSDELAGFGSALGKAAAGNTDFVKNYADRRDAERAALEMSRQRNFGGDVMGMNRNTALGMAGGLTVPLKIPAPAKTMGGRVAQGAALGAKVGAVGGFGMAEGDAFDQAAQTALGTATGLTVGAAIPGVIEGVPRIAQSIAKKVTGSGRKVAIPGQPATPSVETLRPESVPLPVVSPSSDVTVSVDEKANRQILAALLKDGMSLEDARAIVAGRALDTATPVAKPMTLADLATPGGATQRLARGARTNAPASAGRADQFLAARDRTQAARTVSDLNQISRLPDEAPMVTKADIESAARTEAAPHYNAARSAGEVDIRGLEPYVNTPEFKSAKDAVLQRPKFAGKNVNDAEVLDAIYKHIGGARRGETNTQVDEYLRETQQAIKDAIDSASGGAYSKATAAYSGEIGNRDALQLGQSVLNKSAATVRAEMEKLDPSAKRVYQSAAADAIREKLRGLGYNRDAVKAIFNNDTIVQKMRLIMPDEQAFKTFERQMIDEAKMSGTKQVLTGNSQTADKVRDAMDAGGYLDVLSGIATGDPTAVAGRMAGSALKDKLGAMLPGAEEQGGALLSKLLNPDAQAQLGLLDRLIQMERQQQIQANRGGLLLQPAGRASGMATMQLPTTR